MESVSPVSVRGDLSRRFAAFVAERFPFALAPATAAFSSVCRQDPGRDPAAIAAIRSALAESLNRELAVALPEALPDSTPGVAVQTRLDHARGELLAACDGFLRARRSRPR